MHSRKTLKVYSQVEGGRQKLIRQFAVGIKLTILSLILKLTLNLLMWLSIYQSSKGVCQKSRGE
ncbi:hypothetical protein ACS76_09340 [Pantoea vagans]|nr:hypothetical protein ACS76_09340 [Pantoea vagans]